jgi:predicted SAM-dependent methyltransferase
MAVPFRKPKPLKLHLGCREKKIHGYVNIDIRPEVEPDVIDDCFILSSFENNTVDVIYTCHMLEHCPRDKYKDVLRKWYALLKPKGVLRISVPDFQAIADYAHYNGTTDSDFPAIQNLLLGAQQHAYDFHYQLFTFSSLQQNLVQTGFQSVKRYDWRNTEHAFIDDYSQCYLPNICYKTRRPEGLISGNLASLNVEAIK